MTFITNYKYISSQLFFKINFLILTNTNNKTCNIFFINKITNYTKYSKHIWYDSTIIKNIS